MNFTALKRFFLLLFLLQNLPFFSFAQKEEVEVNALEPVVLTATRRAIFEEEVPGAVSLISKREIQGLNPTISLEEPLREVPGVFVNNRYNFSQGDRISIRGLGSRAQYGLRSMKVLLDGIPLTFPDGTTQLNNLNLANIGRIEILKGPSSSLYGNSSAGVILLKSEIPDTNKLSVSPRLTGGSFGFVKGQLAASGTVNKSKYYASVTGTNFEGFREYSQARIYNGNVIFKHAFSEDTRITGILNIVKSPYMLNPGGLTKENAEENPEEVRLSVQTMTAAKEVDQEQLGIRLEQSLGKIGEFSSTVYGIHRGLFNPIWGRVIEVDRVSGGLRNVYEKEFSGEKNSLNLLAGLDLEIQKDERDEYENLGITEEKLNSIDKENILEYVNKGEQILDQQEVIKNAGAFTNLSYNFAKDFTLTGAIRYDYYNFSVTDSLDNKEDLNFSQLSPSAGFLYQINDNLNTYLNYSTGFQTPTANEFSNSPDGSGFNQDLKPERIQSTELGLRQKRDRLQADLSLFYFTVQNQLIPYQISPDSDELFYRNAGKTENKGIEVWLRYEIFPKVALTLSYAYMDYIFTDYEVESEDGIVQLSGNEVPGVPDHRAYGGVIFGGRKGLQAEVNVQYTGDYFANDFNGPLGQGEQENFVNDSYWLTDLKAGYIAYWGRSEFYFFAGVNNVFNVQYNSSVIPNASGNWFFEPAPGRNYYVGLEVPLRVK